MILLSLLVDQNVMQINYGEGVEEIPKHIICQMLKIIFVTLNGIIATPNVHRVLKEIFHSLPKQGFIYLKF